MRFPKNVDLNIIECVGPEVLTFREILEKLLKSMNKKKNSNTISS